MNSLFLKSVLFEPTAFPGSAQSTAVSFSAIQQQHKYKRLVMPCKKIFRHRCTLDFPPCSPKLQAEVVLGLLSLKCPLHSHAGFTCWREAAIPGYQVDIGCKHVVLYFVSTLVAVRLNLLACPNHTLGAILCCCLG